MTDTRESNGPDKLKNKYACYLHHLPSGERSFESGILTDYNCCCDTCLYSTAKPQWLSANWYSGEGFTTRPDGLPLNHCCKCNPRLILATWQPDNPSDECAAGQIHSAAMPLRYRFDQNTGILGSQLWAEYAGQIDNKELKLTISNFEVSPTGGIIEPVDSSGCRWSIFLSNSVGDWSSYQQETDMLNHGTKTCLSVPGIEVSGLNFFGSSSGTLSLSNYDIVKVPFQHRSDNFPRLDYPSISGTGLIYGDVSPVQYYTNSERRDDTVLTPTGVVSPPRVDPGWSSSFVNSTGGNWIEGQEPTGVIAYSPACKELPKVLCVTEYNSGDGYENKIYREFIYDSGFFPIQRLEFHPSHTGIESFGTGVAIAKWDYSQIGNGISTGVLPSLPANEINKSIYLYETYIDAIDEYDGDASLAMSSGNPRYLFVPSFENDTDAAGKDDHVWPGGPYYSHPAIHFQDYSSLSDIKLRTEGENFYLGVQETGQSGIFSSLWLGGFDYSPLPDGDNPNRRSVLRNLVGSGVECSCDKVSAYANQVRGLTGDGLNNWHHCFVRAGKCSCWEYFCSDKCRCLPKYLCYEGFLVDIDGGSNEYYSGTATWDASNKCWTHQADSGDISFCIGKNGNGFVSGGAGESYNPHCTIGVSDTNHPLVSGVDGTFAFPSKRLTCDIVDMNYSFGDTIYNGPNPSISSYIRLHSSLGPCGSRHSCDIATPCYNQCGSHPSAIVLDLVGYDESEEPIVTCTESITMYYFEDIIPTVLNDELGVEYIALETYCGYRGYNSCGIEFIWRGNTGGVGELTITDPYTGNSNAIYSDDVEFGESWTEGCNPYYVSAEYQGYDLIDPGWCCDGGAAIGYWTFDITEV